LCEELHGQCFESSETDNAHQLSGASSSKDLPEGCLRSISAPTAINNMSGTVSYRSGKGTMDVGTQQGYHLDNPTHPGSARHHSRYGIADMKSQTGCSALK